MKGSLKRTTAAILAALLLATAGTATVTMISGQTSIVEAAEESGVTTITPSYDWYDNSSSSTNYTISTVADLVGLANIVNGTDSRSADTFSGKTITLEKSIDLKDVDWTPIGTVVFDSSGDIDDSSSHPFAGTFDGGEKIIQNLTYETSDVSAGVFGYVTGTVQNLKVEDVSITNTSSDGNATAAGGVIATLKNGKAINIIVLSGSVSCSLRAGGIIGDVRGTSATVSDCINYATVSGSKYTGGITGATHDLNIRISSTEIKNCKNYGVIDGVNEVGGILGYSDNSTISNCHNYNSVTGMGNYGTGGIVGFDAYNPPNASFSGSTIENCSNSGTITGSRAGGILGTFGLTPGKSQPTILTVYSDIKSCTNTGNIVGPSDKCGTFFGYQISYANGDGSSYIKRLKVRFTDCTNGGTVNGEPTDALSPSPYTA
jgi:hypothetical protein